MFTNETLDKLYLEWSQHTHARTEREINYKNAILKALALIDHSYMRNGQSIKAITILKAAVNNDDPEPALFMPKGE